MRKSLSNPKYESWLFITYILLFGVFFYLNFIYNKESNIWNIIVCGIQFILIGIIFLYSIFKYFNRTNILIFDLFSATNRIYEKGCAEEDIDFKNSLLAERYSIYISEKNRLKGISGEKTLVDVEDFINYSVIDISINRSLLNLVPGVMTGLGILGTFMGLAIGLQYFNTGTAEEISNSIAPLMDGIKVAFHTSIYGMIFSLVFNYVYKKKLEVADKAMESFLSTYKNTYEQHPENDLMNHLVAYTDQIGITMAEKMSATIVPHLERIYQALDGMQQRTEFMANEMSETLKDVLGPQFEAMNKTIESFAATASKNQIDGINEIVDKFVEQMNSALGDGFEELGIALKETCEIQKTQNASMQRILEDINQMVDNLLKINELTDQSTEKLEKYVGMLYDLQEKLMQEFQQLSDQTYETNKLLAQYDDYMRVMEKHESSVTKAEADMIEKVGIITDNVKSLTTSIQNDAVSYAETLKDIVKEIQEAQKESINTIGEQAQSYCKAVSESTKQQIQDLQNIQTQVSEDFKRSVSSLAIASNSLNGDLQASIDKTFEIFDVNLAEIAQHLSGTITNIDSTTTRVPLVVENAYKHLEESFENMHTQMEGLIYSIEELRREVDVKRNLIKDEF